MEWSRFGVHPKRCREPPEHLRLAIHRAGVLRHGGEVVRTLHQSDLRSQIPRKLRVIRESAALLPGAVVLVCVGACS
jgi:hypothetical protein